MKRASLPIMCAVVVALIFQIAPPAQAAINGFWTAVDGDGFVLEHPDGNGGVQLSTTAVDAAGNTYIAGKFSKLDGSTFNSVAKWNGTVWSPLGSGLVRADGKPGIITSMEIVGNELFVAGLFTKTGDVAQTSMSGVAKWDLTTNTWSAVGITAAEINIYDMDVVSANDIYIGGFFTNVPGNAAATSANNVAHWNGSAWTAIAGGAYGDLDGQVANVAAVAVSGSGELYVGGAFSYADGIAVKGMARWNATEGWRSMPGMDWSLPRDIAVTPQGDVFVAGSEGANSSNFNHIARWTNGTWRELGGGLSGTPRSLYFDSVGNLYIAGNIYWVNQALPQTVANRLTVNGSVMWDGAKYRALANAPGRVTSSLSNSGTHLLASGFGEDPVAPYPWTTVLSWWERETNVARGPLTASSADFGTVSVNGGLGSLTVTLTNTGSSAVVPSNIAATGAGVSITGGTCAEGVGIVDAGTCTVTLTWDPSASGSLGSAALNIEYPFGAVSSKSVSLSGVATAAGPAAFSSGAFPSVLPGQTSALEVTVHNAGALTMTPSAITAAGSGVSVVSGGTCGVGDAVVADASCTVKLQWAPSTRGSLANASLTIAYPGGVNASSSLALSGSTLTAGPVSFSSGAFPDTRVGGSGTLTIRAENSGSAPVLPSRIDVTGDGVAIDAGSCREGTAIAVGDYCTVNLSWKPTSSGALKESVLRISFPNGESASSSLTLSGLASAATGADGTQPVVSAPGKVVSLKATSFGRVTWKPVVNDGGSAITTYRVYLRPVSKKTFGSPKTVETTAHTFKNLKPGKYVARVNAVNAAGEGTESFVRFTVPKKR